MEGPFITKITVLQILLTPVTMGLTLWYVVFSRLDFSAIGISSILGFILLGRAIRGASNLKRNPWDIVILPILAFAVIFVAFPIKTYAFITMNKQGWLTRHADTIGGDGQSSSTLLPQGALT